MAELDDKNEMMIQLPWAVPQQALVQTATVIENPRKKLELDLNHSTDTTAISSFGLSVIIALILGCLATWLAYWYGRKSFKLTEMSFKMVVEEIKASQQSAIDLNTKLFEQQIILRNLEEKQNVINSLRDDAATFTIHTETFLWNVISLKSHLLAIKENEEINFDIYAAKLVKQIEIKFDLILESRSKLLFSALELDLKVHDEIDEIIAKVINLATSLKNHFSVKGNLTDEQLKINIQKTKELLRDIKIILKEVLEIKAA